MSLATLHRISKKQLWGGLGALLLAVASAFVIIASLNQSESDVVTNPDTGLVTRVVGIVPASGGLSLETDTGSIKVVLPEGVAPAGTILSVSQILEGSLSPLPDGLTATDHVFEVVLFSEAGDVVELSGEATISIVFDESVFNSYYRDITKLVIGHLKGGSVVWEQLETNIVEDIWTASANVSSFRTFALLLTNPVETTALTNDPFRNQIGLMANEPAIVPSSATVSVPVVTPVPTSTSRSTSLPTSVPTATAVPTPIITPIPKITPIPRPDSRAVAEAYFVAENWSMAIREYSAIIASYPNDRDAHFFRAYSYHRIGSYWPAVQDYDKALEIEPDASSGIGQSVVHNSRGDVYRDLGRYELAIYDYGQAIELEPDYAQAYNGRAITQEKLREGSVWSRGKACSLNNDYCPTPTPLPLPTPTITPTQKPHGMRLYINGSVLIPGQMVLKVSDGEFVIDPAPDVSGRYDQGSNITITAYPDRRRSTVLFGGLDNVSKNSGSIVARGTEWSVTASIIGRKEVVKLETATPIPTPTPVPSVPVIWGGFGSGQGMFHSPKGIAVGSSGHVFIADTGNHRIAKFSASGTYLDDWGVQGSGQEELASPQGIAVGPDGNVYIADTGNHRIKKYDSSGNFLAQWGEQGSSQSKFESPHGIAVGSDGNVYIADTGNHRIKKYDSFGNFLDQWGKQGSNKKRFESPKGIAIGPDGNVYTADTGNHRVMKQDSSGGYLDRWGQQGSGDSKFESPQGIAVASDGKVYVTDTGNHRFKKHKSSGTFQEEWGQQGTGDTGFDSPQAIAIGPDGSIYVVDAGNHRIKRFEP